MTVGEAVVIALDDEVALEGHNAEVEADGDLREGSRDARCDRPIQRRCALGNVVRRHKSWVVWPDSLHMQARRALLELDLDKLSHPKIIDQRGGSVERKLAELVGHDHSATTLPIP